MIVMTPKAETFVDLAFKHLGDADKLRAWQKWVDAPKEFSHGFPVVTPEAAAAALTALRGLAGWFENRIESGEMSEDDEADLENDLAFVEAVTREMSREVGGVN